MKRYLINLYSDTQTLPTDAMRQVIAAAEVGDEQHHEDPSVNALVERTISLLGQEDAVFLPSGTMANEIALLVHCRAGDEVIAHESAHIINFEGGAPAAFAGVMIKALRGPRGLFDAQDVSGAIRNSSRYSPPSRLVVVEQTSNLGGGSVWPLEQMQSVASVARAAGLALHLDGARLMNAAVAAGRRPDEYAAMFDTVFVDFTKGLGAPLGAILAGRKQCIEHAWRWKQRMGGAMRQAGMMAAACLYALDHHVERLREDHENARLLAKLLSELPGISVEPVETNLVFFDVSATKFDAAGFNQALEPHGLRVAVAGKSRLRAVTHLDTPRALIEEAAEIVRSVL